MAHAIAQLLHSVMVYRCNCARAVVLIQLVLSVFDVAMLPAYLPCLSFDLAMPGHVEVCMCVCVWLVCPLSLSCAHLLFLSSSIPY